MDFTIYLHRFSFADAPIFCLCANPSVRIGTIFVFFDEVINNIAFHGIPLFTLKVFQKTTHMIGFLQSSCFPDVNTNFKKILFVLFSSKNRFFHFYFSKLQDSGAIAGIWLEGPDGLRGQFEHPKSLLGQLDFFGWKFLMESLTRSSLTWKTPISPFWH